METTLDETLESSVKESRLGYWDGETPMVYCYMDTNDRFHFSDKRVKGILTITADGEQFHEDLTGVIDLEEVISEEVYNKYRKGVEFFTNCKRDPTWNRLFLIKGADGGVYFNNRVVFTKEEIDQFTNKGLDTNSDEEESDSEEESESSESEEIECDCANESRREWSHKFRKRVWYLGFVSKKFFEKEKDNDNVVIKKEGIEFDVGGEIVHVGMDGAWIGLVMPVEED
jgi:hypothetical protein